VKILSTVCLAVLCVGCDYRVMFPAAPTSNITNNNTNTNTVDIDAHDVINLNPTFPPTTDNPNVPPTPSVPLPVPQNAEGIARTAAHANRGLISKSCQNSQFIDAIVSALRVSDARWGYICNATSGCSAISGDTIAYRATSTNVGVWAVDIIGDHCGTNPTFTWNVVGFAADRQWRQ